MKQLLTRSCEANFRLDAAQRNNVKNSVKRTLGLVLGLLGMAATAHAAPIAYNIALTNTSGIQPTSASFTHDASAPAASAISNFLVEWLGYTFDLTAAANAPRVFYGCEAIAGASGGHLTFDAIFDGSADCGGPLYWSGASSSGAARVSFSSGETYLENHPGVIIDSLWVIPPPGGLPNRAIFADGYLVSPPPAPVPEPASVWLMLCGSVGLAYAVRKRRPVCAVTAAV